MLLRLLVYLRSLFPQKMIQLLQNDHRIADWREGRREFLLISFAFGIKGR